MPARVRAQSMPPAQHQAAHHQFRHGIGVCAGGVEYCNSPLGALVQRNVVYPCARPGNGQQVFVKVIAVHVGGTNQNTVRHRLLSADEVLIGQKVLMNDFRNVVQGFQLIHHTFSFSKAFITAISFSTPSTGMAL